LQPNKIVFFVGRDVYEKGAHVLVEAFGHVARSYEKAKLVIAGKGERKDQKDIAQRLGIQDKVYFAGFIDDETLYKLYKVIDVAVFPSLYEPFGIVALEGMAAGVPVVSSDAGGLNEVVDHGVTGVKTYAGDPSSLAWGILQVLNNSNGAKQMAQMALQKVQNVYDWQKIARQTMEVYTRVWEEFKSSAW
jgi:glycosyltransferase involved in cell wall biosynthesis